MKKGWEIKKFEELIQLNQIGLIKSSKEQGKNNPYRYLKMDSIASDNTLIHTKYVFVDATKDELKKFTLNEGDFLFNTRNSYELVGKTCVFNPVDTEPTLFNNNIMRVVFKKGILSMFINYAFSSEQVKERLQKLKSGTTSVVGIYYNGLKNLEIPLPSLTEQQSIVAILDEAFAAIARAKANAQQNLQNAKELFESYLQGVFENKGEGWEEKTLGEVYDVRDGTHDSPKYYSDGYPFITSKNLKKDELNYNNVKYICEKDFININKRSKVDIGDILFAMIGTIGNPVVIKSQPDFAIKNVALFKVPLSQNSSFLKYFLDSKIAIDKMMKDAKGTTQKFVGLGYLRNFKIQLPSSKTQKAIVQKLNVLKDGTRKLETIYQQKISDLEELKRSVLQKALRGELKRIK